MASPTSARAARVLHHLKRQHITTRETLLRLLFHDAKGASAFNNVLYRNLTQRGLVRTVPLGIAKQVYFQLTEAGAVAADAHRSVTRDLRPRDLFTLYAELLFCYHDSSPRPKLTPEEFDQYFPGRRTTEAFGPYYIDEEHGIRRLGRILVDLADRNLAAAAEKALADMQEFGDDFLAERRVALAVVTTTPRAERQVRACLEPFKGRGVSIRTRHFPALTQLLGHVARPATRGPANA